MISCNMKTYFFLQRKITVHVMLVHVHNATYQMNSCVQSVIYLLFCFFSIIIRTRQELCFPIHKLYSIKVSFKMCYITTRLLFFLRKSLLKMGCHCVSCEIMRKGHAMPESLKFCKTNPVTDSHNKF